MNQLKVKEQQAIIALYEQGWSKRKIARELGLDRLTARRYIAAAGLKSSTSQTGSGEAVESKSPGVQTGSSSGGLCARWGEQIERVCRCSGFIRIW
jgi:Homeodomain-like domain